MNYTEKILAEFDEWIKIKRTEDVDFHYGVGLWVVTEMKEFIASKITQALAEERERVGKIIEESHWECPEHGLPKFQKTDCVECDSALEINVVLGALLSSLDTNPKDI